MTFYHVEFAKIGHSVTGGEVCMLELIRHFASLGYRNVLLTTDNGEQTYRKELGNVPLVEYRTIDSYALEQKFGLLGSYVLRTFKAAHFVASLILQPDDVVLCHSDFFPNAIPAWLINRHSPRARSVNFFHMKAPRLFFGYAGEFTNVPHWPTVKLLHYQLNQWLYRMLTFPKTLIATVNPHYEQYLHQRYPHNRVKVLEHFGGARSPQTMVDKRYDVVWLGRFHAQKGIGDLALVIKHLALAKPDVRAVIIGDGEPAARQQFEQQLETLGVRHNVELAGFVGGDKKFDYLARSRVFIMTSYYESFGIVVLEAMACGLPVVAYDLPVYGVFGGGISRVALGDHEALARKALQLLDDAPAYRSLQGQARLVAERHSWEKTGDELLEALYV